MPITKWQHYLKVQLHETCIHSLAAIYHSTHLQISLHTVQKILSLTTLFST